MFPASSFLCFSHASQLSFQPRVLASFRNWKCRELAHSALWSPKGGGEENRAVQRATERTEKKGTHDELFFSASLICMQRKSKKRPLWVRFSGDDGDFRFVVPHLLVWSHHGEGPEDKSLPSQENNRSKVNSYHHDDLCCQTLSFWLQRVYWYYSFYIITAVVNSVNLLRFVRGTWFCNTRNDNVMIVIHQCNR